MNGFKHLNSKVYRMSCEILDLEIKIIAHSTRTEEWLWQWVCFQISLYKWLLSFDIFNISEEKFGGGTLFKHNSSSHFVTKIFTPVISVEFDIGAKYNFTIFGWYDMIYLDHALSVPHFIPIMSLENVNLDKKLRIDLNQVWNCNQAHSKCIRFAWTCNITRVTQVLWAHGVFALNVSLYGHIDYTPSSHFSLSTNLWRTKYE